MSGLFVIMDAPMHAHALSCPPWRVPSFPQSLLDLLYLQKDGQMAYQTARCCRPSVSVNTSARGSQASLVQPSGVGVRPRGGETCMASTKPQSKRCTPVGRIRTSDWRGPPKTGPHRNLERTVKLCCAPALDANMTHRAEFVDERPSRA